MKLNYKYKKYWLKYAEQNCTYKVLKISTGSILQHEVKPNLFITMCHDVEDQHTTNKPRNDLTCSDT